MADLSNTRRIGALVPATNPVVEPDFYRVVPPEITVHFERMWNGTWGTQPESAADTGHRLSMSSGEANEVDWALFGFDVNKMNDDVARGASALSNIGPDVLVYACTSGTWHKGYMAFDQKMAETMEESSGVPSITAVTSCISAMRHMGSRRISIAGPYRNYHLRNRLKPLVEEAGFEVLSADGEPWMQDSMNPREIDAESPRTIVDFAVSVAHEDADTVFLPGTAWRALDSAEELEQRLGKTVITVNQASIWLALCRLGWKKPIPGYGSLLRSFE
jgi:maleate cis-trans isomerase